VCYASGMNERDRLTKAVEEAQQELDAAKRLSEVNRAAKKLQRARSELRSFEDEQPKRPKRGSSRGRGSAGDAS
jgi:hypothetical protein